MKTTVRLAPLPPKKMREPGSSCGSEAVAPSAMEPTAVSASARVIGMKADEVSSVRVCAGMGEICGGALVPLTTTVNGTWLLRIGEPLSSTRI